MTLLLIRRRIRDDKIVLNQFAAIAVTLIASNAAMNAKKVAVSRPIKISSMNFAVRYGSDKFTAAVKIEQDATTASDAL